MGLDDGEWICDEATGRAWDEEPDDSGAADGWPADGWPADGWLDDERTAGAQRPGAGKGRGRGGVTGFSVRAAAAVAVVAAAAGAAAGLFLVRGTPAASAARAATPGVSAPGASAPGASAPGGSGTGLPALPGLSGQGNGQLRMMLTGRVLAVSGASITIGGDGPSVTAAVTHATTITGTARGIGAVQVGDEVSAQITGTASHLTATAIQDPAGTT